MAFRLSHNVVAVVIVAQYIFGGLPKAIQLTEFHHFLLLNLHYVTDQLHNSMSDESVYCAVSLVRSLVRTDGVILMDNRCTTLTFQMLIVHYFAFVLRCSYTNSPSGRHLQNSNEATNCRYYESMIDDRVFCCGVRYSPSSFRTSSTAFLICTFC